MKVVINAGKAAIVLALAACDAARASDADACADAGAAPALNPLSIIMRNEASEAVRVVTRGTVPQQPEWFDIRRNGRSVSVAPQCPARGTACFQFSDCGACSSSGVEAGTDLLEPQRTLWYVWSGAMYERLDDRWHAITAGEVVQVSFCWYAAGVRPAWDNAPTCKAFDVTIGQTPEVVFTLTQEDIQNDER